MTRKDDDIGFSDWVEQAARALSKAALARRGETLTIERLRSHCQVDPPDDLRSWGPATMLAIRRRYIVPVDAFARAASSNGAPKPMYRLGPVQAQ
jgi:hypothetical protein